MLWVLIRMASTNNIRFYGEIMKIIPKLSQNTSLSVPLIILLQTFGQLFA